MGACQPVTFKNITRQKFQMIRARVNAQAAKFVNNGDTGSATGKTPLGQFAAEWAYDEANQTLTITCTQKPVFVSESYMTAKMQALVESINA
jgi:transcription initiation factor TFIID subunit TAF12